MKYPYIFFDLDGTISNSAEGITNSVAYALEKMGICPPPREKLMHYIGPPLIRTFSDDYSLTEAEGLRAVELYREFYNVTGIFQCTMYQGTDTLLRALRDSGRALVLATCKPTVMATRVLAHFGLSDLFTMISGPELDGTRNEKHEVIAYAMERLGITDPKSILMVGDRRDDALGAKACGVDCVGVLWGFGSEEELLEAGVQKIIEKPLDLMKILSD